MAALFLNESALQSLYNTYFKNPNNIKIFFYCRLQLGTLSTVASSSNNVKRIGNKVCLEVPLGSMLKCLKNQLNILQNLTNVFLHKQLQFFFFY